MTPHERLGVAIVDAGYTWTPEMRSAWEDLDVEIKTLQTQLEDCTCQGGHSEAYLKAKGRI